MERIFRWKCISEDPKTDSLLTKNKENKIQADQTCIIVFKCFMA